MSGMSRSSLSVEIAGIDAELSKLERELGVLKDRKKELLAKKRKILQRIDEQNAITANDSHWESDEFPWSAESRKVLSNVFHLSDFRPLQRSVINCVLSKEDALVVMSTGSGKSLCYQLPAAMSKGIVLVVSPLVSLIQDQLMQLKALGIQATTLNHSTSKEEVKTIMQAITDPHSTLRLLYVTPEKLAQSKRLMNKLEKCDEAGLLKLVAIDEVHCCSQWGHDFRPDFKFLNVVKRQFKDVPIVGLTATATYDVVEDLKNILNIPAAVVFRAGFNRPNLFYEVVPKPSKLEDSVADISAMIKNRFSGESGIVYCFSKKDCEELATALRQQGIQAHFYHADMDTEQRKRTHEKWTAGAINVMVATVAFGMGIDKPDVRYVIHHSLPKSMENYYQESGRAGRDGKDATCVLYFRLSDLFRQSTMVCTEKTGIANLYSMLVYCLQSKSCRRCLIAEHFNEVWDESWCSKKCDVCCGKTSSSTSVNIEPCLDIFIQLLKECEQKAKNESSRRITGLKLVELAMKRLKNDYSKTALEYAVAHFLRYGYLKEEFHFTPYSIVSYVVAGAKCLTGVQDNQESLTVQIPLNSGEANPVAAKPQISSRKRTAEIDGAVDKRRLINCASPEITEIVL